MTPAPLAHRIAERIREEGPISIAEYMAMALGDPDYGYYTSRDPFGTDGDFTTAPEISQVFGELIGLWCAAVWQNMGEPDPVHFIELGPGRGTLVADALRAVGRVLPGFTAAVRVNLVETSPSLRSIQAKQLKARHPNVCAQWWNHQRDVPSGPALIVANEFFDALPVRQFVRGAEGWCERHVGLTDDGRELDLVDLPISGLPPDVPPRLASAPVAGIVEVSAARSGETAQIAERLVVHGGAAVIIDYGHLESAVGDTLQGLRRHQFRDVLERPGETDLTTHVDFEALAGSAIHAGAAVSGPLPQGLFLCRLGAAQRLESLVRGKPTSVAANLVEGVRRLTDPKAMGFLFKVMAISSPGLSPLPGFDAADHRRDG